MHKALIFTSVLFLFLYSTNAFRLIDFVSRKTGALPQNPVCGDFNCPYGTVACKKVVRNTSDLTGIIVKINCLASDNTILDSKFTRIDNPNNVVVDRVEFTGVNDNVKESDNRGFN